MKSIMIIDCMRPGPAVGKALHKDTIQDCTYCIQSNCPADILQSAANLLINKEMKQWFCPKQGHAAVTGHMTSHMSNHMASDLKVTTSL